MAESGQPNNHKPVAYDTNGQPLYAAPKVTTSSADPAAVGTQVVHIARATEPVEVQVSADAKRRHEQSRLKFPWLNLSKHEYVISAVPRHSIGMWAPIGLTALVSGMVIVAMVHYPEIAAAVGFVESSQSLAYMIGWLLIAAFVLAGYLAMWVYVNNRFFLTNESVIQEIQTSIFSKREQTVSLANIEDASFTQKGPLQLLLNYGSIRLSTEGDETTYLFDYVVNPRHEIAILNNAVEAFKNGRPVDILNDEN